METNHVRSVQLVFKRTEAKYLLDGNQKERLCALMEGRMVPDEFGASTIRNLYLDTPSLLFARRSAERPFYKEKIQEELAYAALREGGVSPVCSIAYEREAFYGAEDRDLRFTFDRHVRMRWESLNLVSTAGDPLIASDCHLLEIKTAKAMPLWLVAFLSEERLRKTSFSKYGEAARRHLEEASAPSGTLLRFPEAGHFAGQRLAR